MNENHHMALNYDFVNGVYISKTNASAFADFEKNYLTIREKEKRILTIDEVRKLPFVAETSSDFELWNIRRKSINRFLKYLSKKKKHLAILDIGCGNGFFTNLMAKQNHQVVGLDVNLTELQQAAMAFPDSNIKWLFADFIKDKLPFEKFDVITFCTSFHYFNNPKVVLDHCLSLLNKEGEIHIIDSPFYNETSKIIAKENSQKHFQSMGVPDMINHYHHHTYTVLSNFNYRILYQPQSLIKRILRLKDSPFPWLSIK